MADLRSVIDDFVADRLFNLAWGNLYPLHSLVALDSFSRGFIDEGFEVNHFSESKELYFRSKSVSIKNEEEILSGGYYFPKASPISLRESVEDVCYESGWKVQGVRMDCQPTVSRVMDRVNSHLYCTIRRFQEHAMLSVTKEDEELKSPELLDSLLSNYSSSDISEIFYVGDLKNLGQDYYHRTLQKRFWANYIERLSEIKGYDVKYTLNRKSAIIQMQNASLVEGTRLF